MDARVAQLDRWRESDPDQRWRVDDQTWHDLGLDDVFEAIDHTHSVVGAQSLYWLLRHPVARPAALAELEQQLEALDAAPGTRAWLRARLERLPPRIGWMVPTLLYDEDAAAPVPIPRFVLTLLPLVLLGSAVLAALWMSELWLLSALAFASSIYAHFTLSRSLSAQMSSLMYLRGLLILARAVVRERPAGLEDLAAQLEDPVQRCAAIIRKTRLFGIQDPFEIFTYLRILTLVEARGYADCVALIREQRHALQQIHARVGWLDALLCVAKLREDPSYSRPQLLDEAEALRVEDLRHPSLNPAVPNTVVLGRTPEAGEATRGLLLTGLNMSGKSTLLRALGVDVILAQTLATTRASAYAGPCLRVLSAIEVHDDLLAGRSYYLSEVEAVRRLVRAAEQGAPHLFLLDETFRGTNSVERVAAATGVLEHLVRRHWVVAATHDMQLCELIAGDAGDYANVHFGDLVDAEGVRFDYTLRPGVCPTTNAIALLEHAGFPATIVARSRELLEPR